MQLLESHEMRLYAGGLCSTDYDPNQWVWEYENGDPNSIYDDNTIAGDAFSAWMSGGAADAAMHEFLRTIDVRTAPINPDASLVAAVTSFLFDLIGIDTGFDPMTGLRRDGQDPGAGCGNHATDWIVPDSVFGIDIMPACTAHDMDYANQIGRDLADNNFRQAVYYSALSQGAPEWAAGVLSAVYYTAVHTLGGDSYEAAGKPDQ
jgi:hypothetical protein